MPTSGSEELNGLGLCGRNKLYDVSLTDVFALDLHRKQIVRRLGAQPTFFGNLTFYPVEDVISGRRYEPRSDLLVNMTDMEVIAWMAAS